MAISFITAASANATSVAIPSTTLGDLILVFAYNNASTTLPTAPAGWTSLGSNTTTATAGAVFAKRLAAGETTTGVFTGATNIVAMIYRGSMVIGTFASGVGSSATITYPTIALKEVEGSSWVVCSAIEKSATAGMNGTTAGLPSNRTSQTIVNGLDSNGGVAAFAAQNLTVTTTGRFIAFTVELRNAINEGETLALTDAVTIGYGNRVVDSLALTESVALGYGNRVTDQLVLADSYTQNLLAALTLSIADTITLSDFVPTEQLEYQLALVCPHLGDNLADAITPQLGSGAQLTIVAADSLALTDSLQIGYGNSVNDPLVLSDSISALLAYLLATADSLTLSDSIALTTEMQLPLSDQLNAWSEALAIGYGNRVSDQLVLSEALAIGIGLAASETLTLVDALGIGYGLAIADPLNSWQDALALTLGNAQLTLSLSDQLILSDSLAIGVGVALSDALVIADALALGYGLATVDQLSLSDSLASIVEFREVLSDQLNTWADKSALGYGNSCSDTLTLSESLRVGYGLANSDQLVLTDAFAFDMGLPEKQVIVNDQLVLSEALGLGLGFGAAVVDALSVTDSLGVGYGNTCADQMALADSVVVQMSIALAVVDTLTLSDRLTVGYGLAVSEQISLVDNFATFGTWFISVADQLTLTDAINLRIPFQLTLADTLSLSDAMMQAMVLSLGVQDQVALADSITLQQVQLLQVQDTLGVWQDSLNLFGAMFLALSETLSIQDALASNLSYQLTVVDAINFWQDSFFAGSADITPLFLSDALSLSDHCQTTVGAGAGLVKLVSVVVEPQVVGVISVEPQVGLVEVKAEPSTALELVSVDSQVGVVGAEVKNTVEVDSIEVS